MPAIYDQGQLGSCTANALAAAMEYELMQQTNKTAPALSRLAIYYGEREMEGTITEDAGASLSDGIMFLHKTGACSESTWPYVDHGNTFTVRPSQRCYDEAKNNKDTDDISHAAVQQSLTAIQTVLAHKLPVTVGLMLYQSFESPQTTRTGIVNMPHANETLLGGHAVLIVGYDDTQQRFIVRNSWGTSWGQKGYFTIPYQYVLNPRLAFDFYTISKVGA